MSSQDTISVRFGGEARELWTNDGLRVSYSGGVILSAIRAADGWRAVAPSPARLGNVKAELNEHSRAVELAALINSGGAPPLTDAYFRACSDARNNILRARNAPSLPEGALPLFIVTNGDYDALRPIELLRALLDDVGLGWDEAVASVSNMFAYSPDGRAKPGYRRTAPLGAVRALCARTANLITAVNEKLCQKLWDIYPGDWRAIGSSCVIRDDEVDFSLLAAALCGLIRCSREMRAGKLRAFYTLYPDKFEDDDDSI